MLEIAETDQSASSSCNFRKFEKLIEKIVSRKWSIKFN